MFPPQMLQQLQTQFGGGRGSGMVPIQLPPGFGGAMPRPFEGFGGGGYKSPGFQPSFGPQPMPAPQMPMGFEGGMPGWSKGGSSPFAAMLQMMQQGGMPGMTSGATGSRGPAASPFLGLQRFAGPFGNGGGPIAPGFQGGFASPWQPQNQWY